VTQISLQSPANQFDGVGSSGSSSWHRSLISLRLLFAVSRFV